MPIPEIGLPGLAVAVVLMCALTGRREVAATADPSIHGLPVRPVAMMAGGSCSISTAAERLHQTATFILRAVNGLAAGAVDCDDEEVWRQIRDLQDVAATAKRRADELLFRELRR